MFYLYFLLISFSLVGYGLISTKLLEIKTFDVGLLGILGLISLSLISYITSFFFVHDYYFNSFFLVVGLIFFLINFKLIDNYKIELLKFFSVFFILIFFILIAKNHDDFPYYHFPYIILLTEFTHPIGIGQLNNGFRSPSSIFFISSMFYLPKISFYLFHITPALILGFSNLIFLNKIFKNLSFNENLFINILSLFCLLFVNIFFYRLAEHGTDRSGMVLIFISIIFLFTIINNKTSNQENTDLIKSFLILIIFVITIKPFYLINLPLIGILLFYKKTQKIFFDLFFSKVFYFCILLIFCTFFYTFINSGCIIFPLTFTCNENLFWSLGNDTILDVKIWFELWSKAGATPHLIVENRLEYISNLNWLSTWFQEYFFNKVSDYILGLFVLSIIVFLSFNKKLYFKDKEFNYNYKLVYFFLIICFFEWFLKHPTLRYGGYHILALLIFIPISLFLGKLDIDRKKFIKKSFVLIIIGLLIFLTRNFTRLNKEISIYSYKPFTNPNYKFIGGDKDFYFRYNDIINQNYLNYKKIKIFGFEKLITKIEDK